MPSNRSRRHAGLEDGGLIRQVDELDPGLTGAFWVKKQPPEQLVRLYGGGLALLDVNDSDVDSREQTPDFVGFLRLSLFRPPFTSEVFDH